MVAMVIEDFAARPARPGVAHRPEIVAGRDTDDTAFGQPRNLAPQIECLVVGVIDSRGQLFGRQPPRLVDQRPGMVDRLFLEIVAEREIPQHFRSEEHTSELQSLMRISYAVICLKITKNNNTK